MSRPSDELIDLAAGIGCFRGTGLDLTPEGVAAVVDALVGIARRVIEIEDCQLRVAGALPVRATLQVIVGGRP